MKYSIITINYNNRDGLRRTIESVVNQTCQDFEYIVIDGGSTDGSVDVIKEYANRIDYWVSEPDKGIYNAMNKGIRQAHGEYLNFMNSGDCFYDNECLFKVSESKLKADIIVGRDYHCNPQTGGEFTTIFPRRLSMLTFCMRYLPHQSSFFRNEICQKFYDEHYKIVSDWKFYIERIVFDGCSVSFLNEIIAWREQDGISSEQASKSQSERSKVLEELIPKGMKRDYDVFMLWDYSTLEKLVLLSQNKRIRSLLTIIIKILYRTVNESCNSNRNL